MAPGGETGDQGMIMRMTAAKKAGGGMDNEGKGRIGAGVGR